METDAAPVANAHLALPGQGKVKFFGRELPPKCALRDCWLTDDGATFYCTDFSCNRHKYRRTKHDRYSRFAHLDPARVPSRREGGLALPAGALPAGALPAAAQQAAAEPGAHVWPLVPFKCPQCGSADLQMRLLQNHYECLACAFVWR